MTPEELSQYIRLRCVEEGDCLHWYSKARSASRKRHPQMRLEKGGPPVLVRRVLYEAEKGPIKPGHMLAPKCGDNCCIEPKHQKQLTPLEWGLLGSARASVSPTRSIAVRASRVAAGLTKLTPELAQEIRLSNESGMALAKKYGVSDKAISDVRLGKSWAEVGSPFAGLFATNDTSSRRAA